MKRIFYLWLALAGICIAGCTGEKKSSLPAPDIKSKITTSLENDEIRYWYPRVIDTVYGGYLSRYSYDWKEQNRQDKYIVYEGRHLWTTSMLYLFMPQRTEFLTYAKAGFPFIKDKMWDPKAGGFFIAVDRQGNPLPNLIGEKRIYGQAFSLYGMAKYFLASGDTAALDLAKKEFNWLEKGAHDARYGGYWEFLYRDGKPMKETDKITPSMQDRALQGLKDFNSSIHILEALTTLYEAWPDPVVKIRLTEMLNIINRTMIDPKGYLVQYFYGNWQRVPGKNMKQKTGDDKWLGEPITFGHDIETAYLLLEAAESLGWDDSTVMPTAIKLTEHTIKFGWDKANGGIFNEGSHVRADSVIIIDNHKSWWAEIEALNTFLLMSQKVPADQARYYGYFLKQWDYIDRYLIDHTYGEFFTDGTDTDPATKLMLKAHEWKASYHTSRGLVNCIKRLEDKK